MASTTREPPTIREPAGVESLFHFPRRQQRNGGHNSNKEPRWRRPWKRKTTIEEEEEDHHVVWNGHDVQQAQKELTLPSWACVHAEEERRVAAMKLLLKDDLRALENETLETPNGGAAVKVLDAFPDVYGDLRLLRFLRKDKKQDPVSASVRYRNFLNWRRDNRVDQIRMEVQEAPFEPPFPLNVVSQYIPCDFHLEGIHKDDTIPALLHVSDWDTAGIARLQRQGKLSMQEFLRYWTYVYESIHLQLYQTSLQRQTMVYIDEICDLKGLHMKQFAPGFATRFIKPWVYLTQHNYPETAKHIVFLNPPSILKLAWALVVPFVSPSTVDKIRMHGGFDGNCLDFIQDQDINRDELASIHTVKHL